LEKLEKLITKAGMGDIDFKERFAALKIHFGEPGNLAYIRHNYVRVVVDFIKKRGGRAFLTDCNTLYVGRRKNAIDHLDAAYENGFNPLGTGCHVIIADGVKGTDDVEVPINGEHVKNAKIGKALMDADIVISLTHFKGHMSTGFGGTFKNIGMGGGSRAGKMEMHNAGKPQVNPKKCIGCKSCARDCAHNAITYENKTAEIDHKKCVGCGRCIGACSFNAVAGTRSEAKDILNKKIAEYTWAILKGRPHFHVSFVMDISPDCDCHGENDLPIIPDVGIFASFDPVALDRACVDAANAQSVMPGSILSERRNTDKDHFKNLHPGTDWKVCLAHGEKLGLGTMKYELIKV
jgi:uncharacterized Fe-S center protein